MSSRKSSVEACYILILFKRKIPIPFIPLYSLIKNNYFPFSPIPKIRPIVHFMISIILPVLWDISARVCALTKLHV